MSKPTDTAPGVTTTTATATKIESPTGPASKQGTLAAAASSPATRRTEGSRVRVRVNKAYKMYIGGAFVRSESGRYAQAVGESEGSADPSTVNVPRGSRKDARDAVLAAKNAHAGWAGRTAYNRGQILYRLAEMMESRRAELVTSLTRGGLAVQDAEREVDVAVDRAVYYAGFADKFQSLLASSNPVSGPHFGFSIPDAMGVVAIVAPARPVLLGLVSTVLPAVVGGNTVVVIASAEDPRTAVVFCECLATSDLPGGVVNLITGDAAEIAPHLAKHREVAALEAFTADTALRTTLEREATASVKRVRTSAPLDGAAWEADGVGQGLGWIERHLETKTIWHPVGM
jgi:acyl-CoA reductase-like NAD-dependent aldehyde dehydrogenase